MLNGSEVTASEREKSERHFLRYFQDKKLKPDCYQDLQKKHGKVTDRQIDKRESGRERETKRERQRERERERDFLWYF